MRIPAQVEAERVRLAKVDLLCLEPETRCFNEMGCIFKIDCVWTMGIGKR